MVESVTVRKCVRDLSEYYGISRLQWSVVKIQRKEIEQDAVSLLQAALLRPAHTIPDNPYFLVPAGITQASHKKMSDLLTLGNFPTDDGRSIKVHVLINNGSGFTYQPYRGAAQKAFAKNPDFTTYDVVCRIMREHVAPNGPDHALAFVSHLCAERGETLHGKDMVFSTCVIPWALLSCILSKPGNGGKKKPCWDKVWRDLYQMVGRAFFSSPDDVPEENLPWIVCDDDSNVIHHNMLAREKLAVCMGGLGEDSDDELERIILDHQKAADLLKVCGQRVLQEKHLPHDDTDVENMLHARFIMEQCGTLDFHIPEEDWVVVSENEEDRKKFAEALVDWMRNIDPNQFQKRDVRAKYKALSTSLCKRIVCFEFHDETGRPVCDPVPYRDLRIDGAFRGIHKAVKVVYNLIVLPSVQMIKFVPTNRPLDGIVIGQKRPNESEAGPSVRNTRARTERSSITSLVFEISSHTKARMGRENYKPSEMALIWLQHLEDAYDNAPQENELYRVISHFGGIKQVSLGSDTTNPVYVRPGIQRGVHVHLDLKNSLATVQLKCTLSAQDILVMFCKLESNKGFTGTAVQFNHAMQRCLPICFDTIRNRRIQDGCKNPNCILFQNGMNTPLRMGLVSENNSCGRKGWKVL